MSDDTQIKVPAWYSPDEIQEIQRDLLGSAAKVLVLCLGGKGGVGKTTIALQIADLCAEVGPVLAIDTDPANRHFHTALMRETGPGSDNFVPRRTGIACVKQRLRAEDSTGRVDPTLCQDMIEHVIETAERFVVVDFPAGDTETTRRCAEIIVESCREAKIRLGVVVAAGAVDPTALEVLKELRPMLIECDPGDPGQEHRAGDQLRLARIVGPREGAAQAAELPGHRDRADRRAPDRGAAGCST